MIKTNYNLFKQLSQQNHSRNNKLLILKNFSINIATALSMLSTSKDSSFKTKTLNNYSSNQSSVRTLASTRDIKQSLSKSKELHTLPAIANRPTMLLINKKKLSQRAVSIFSNKYYTPFKNQMKKNKIYDILHQINGVKFKVKT